MVDQTQDEILEVQTKNKQIKYATDTAQMFDEWLKQCPIVYYRSEPVEPGEACVEYTFDTTTRRK